MECMGAIIQLPRTPTINVFDSGRLSPTEMAQSLSVWKKFLKTQLSLLRELEMAPFASDSNRQIVCLLQRPSPHFEFIVLNCRLMLGPEWGFQLVTSPTLVPWAKALLKERVGVKILPMLGHSENINELMRTLAFWERLAGENLLMIGTDSIICHRRINEFLQYDYVAAAWRKEDVSPWCRYGGGVSLRKKSVMLQICSECNVNSQLIPNESIFFSIMLNLQSGRYHLPELSVALRFAVERCYQDHPFALHKTWQFVPHKRLENILEEVEMPGTP